MKLDINKYKNNDNEKVKITFSINKDVITTFKQLTKSLKLNQSLLIEDMMKEINKQLTTELNKQNKQKNNTKDNTNINK